MTPAEDGFRPYPLTRGGHRQTLLSYWARQRLAWPHPAEDLVVEAEGGARLLVRASWQREPERRPTLAIVHGLGGSSESPYGVALGRLAFAGGWNVARMNLRGAGDSHRLCALLYNAGLATDVLCVLEALARRTPRLALAGFSLGANLAVLAASRHRERLPEGLFAVAAVSAPLDLVACAESLQAPGNRLYQLYYLRKLRADYRRRQRLRPDLLEAGLERSPRTIREYDEAITAPQGGFASADEYYARSSGGPWLTRVETPLLLLAAADDPLIPIGSVDRWPLPPGGAVQLEVTSTGGHVGFLAPSRAPGRFWAADRVMAFLAQRS